MDGDDSGFLARWSRRKALVRQGQQPGGPEPTAPSAPALAAVESSAIAAEPVASITAATPQSLPVQAADVEPPLTLADVAQWTPESDFTRFVAPGVNGEVKNAALKKLFGDPHFNVMDGLDTYIDDYNKADPLPAGVALQMMQAKFLGLLEPDPAPVAQKLATATATPIHSLPEPPHGLEAPAPLPDENADLRLQSHDAAGRPGAEPGVADDGERQP